MCDQSFDIKLGQEVIHQKYDRLRLLTMSNPLGSVDKRDAMWFHRNTVKILVALHKKIVTGLDFNDIAKMQWYL